MKVGFYVALALVALVGFSQALPLNKKFQKSFGLEENQEAVEEHHHSIPSSLTSIVNAEDVASGVENEGVSDTDANEEDGRSKGPFDSFVGKSKKAYNEAKAAVKRVGTNPASLVPTFTPGVGNHEAYFFYSRVNLDFLDLPSELYVDEAHVYDGMVDLMSLVMRNEASPSFVSSLKLKYHELVLAVPFIRIKGQKSKQMFTYPLKIYVDSKTAVAGGTMYGYDLFKKDVETTSFNDNKFKSFSFDSEFDRSVRLFNKDGMRIVKDIWYEPDVEYMQKVLGQAWMGVNHYSTSDDLSAKYQCARMIFDWAGSKTCDRSYLEVDYKNIGRGIPDHKIKKQRALYIFVDWKLENPGIHCWNYDEK